MDEDAVLTAIGKLQGQMEGIDSRLDRIENNQLNNNGTCQKCRAEIDGKIQIVHSRINKIVKTHTGEAAVKTWWDSNLTRGSIISGVVLGVLGLIMQIRGH